MRRFVKFALYEPAWKVWPLALLLVLLLGTVARWASGGFSSIAFDETQNIEFEAALNRQPPLPALVAAGQVNANFEATMRQRLAETANRLLRSGDSVDLSQTPAGTAEEADWTNTYVCGLEGWREHRSVIRKLVSQGFGNCGWTARRAADSPLIYERGRLGWFILLLLWASFLAAVFAAVILFLTRRAHQWLFASKRHF